MEFLSNEKLGLRNKRKKNDNENDNTEVKIKNLKNLIIGLKEGQSSVDIPELKDMRDDVQREDGELDFTEEDRKQQPFQKEWLDKQNLRREILENHKDYKFLTLVAGHSNTIVETFFFNEDVNMEYTRKVLLENQYKSKEANVNIDLEKLKAEKSVKQNNLIEKKKALELVRIKQKAFKDFGNFASTLTEWIRSNNTIKRLNLMKRLVDVYLEVAKPDQFAVSTLPSIKTDIIDIPKVSPKDKETIYKTIKQYIPIQLQELLIPGKVLKKEPEFDKAKKSYIPVDIDYTEKGFVARFLNAKNDIENAKTFKEIETTRLIEILVDMTDFIFFSFSSSSFDKTAKDEDFNNFIKNKIESFKKLNEDDTINKKLTKIEQDNNILIQKLYESLLLFILLIGVKSSSLNYLNRIKKIRLNDEDEDDDEENTALLKYCDYLKENYSYDTNIIYKFLQSDFTFDIVDLNLFNDFINDFINKLEGFLPAITTQDSNLRIYEYLDERDDVVRVFTNFIESLLNNLGSYKQYGTISFIKIVNEVIAQYPDDSKKFLGYSFSTQFDFIYTIYYEKLQMIYNQIEKEINNETKIIEILENRIIAIQSGEIKISDVKLPYRQKRTWVEQPENSGTIRIKPIVTAAILAAYDFVTKSTKLRADIEAFQVGSISSVFARLVAIYMDESKVTNPTQYYHKDASSELKAKKLDIVMDLVRNYEVRNKQVVRKGEVIKYDNIKESDVFW